MNYEIIGDGKNIIYLHGYKMDLNSFKNVINKFRKNYLLDLPGFGKSKLDKGIDLLEYVNILHNFIIKHNIDDVILVGHSFGGRIASKYASLYNVKKLILINSPLINYFDFKIFIKKTLNKFNKLLKIKYRFISKDYKESNDVLKGVMKKCLIDQTSDLKKITCDTLIIQSTKDKIVKKRVGIKINKLIKNSQIKFIKSNHFPMLNKSFEYYKIQEEFLGDILCF